MNQSYEKIAAQILQTVGPRENILQITCCMTRLRLTLLRLPDLEAVKRIPGVLGVVVKEPELQIVIGPGKVNQVKEAFETLCNAENTAADSKVKFGEAKKLHEQIRQKNATPFKLLLKKVSGIFLPLIPAFIACGLVTGLLNIVLRLEPLYADTAFIQILKVVGNAAFWGINLFVGVNAAKEFGASPMLGGTMAAIISHPALGGIFLFGQELVPARGGIIAVLLVVAFSSWLEKQIRRRMPPMLDLFLTPLLVILLSTAVAILALQPLGGLIADTIGFAAAKSIDQGGFVTGFILGGTFLPLVMTGIHQGLTPIHAQLLTSTGVTILLPVLAMAGAGQVGASLAVYSKTKNSALKKLIASALPVGIMGVGEPLIYGVTLPLGKPFIGACIGGAFGGAVQAAGFVGATTLGLSGLPLAACADKIGIYLVGLFTAYIAGFAATWLIGFNDPAGESNADNNASSSNNISREDSA